jgi:methylenetetrahydrofolate reductase (NADPH)
MAPEQDSNQSHPQSCLSFEFFPPKTEAAMDRLVTGPAMKLAGFNPDFVSVTYGAGGATRGGTPALVGKLLDAGLSCVPHLSFGGSTADELNTLVDQYKSMGIKQLLCLRGDNPAEGTDQHIYAKDLVQYIQKHYPEDFELVVAAYPEVHPDAANAKEDLGYFANKVRAGASSAITQYFYSADAYGYFLQSCANEGLSLPIHVGVMPITNIDALERFSAKAGADIPRWLSKSMATHAGHEKDLIAFGADIVTNLCEKLLQMGAPGLHFYTLNRWGASSQICRNLGFLET